MHSKSTHRHGVILPVFLGLLTVSMALSVSSSTALRAETRLPAATGGWVHLGKGASFHLFDGTQIGWKGGALTLQRGSLLLSGMGKATLETPVGELITIAGTLFAFVDDNRLSVAALDAPVLLSIDTQLVVIPPNVQLWIRDGVAISVEELPRDFLAEKKQYLQNRIDYDDLPAVASSKPSVLPGRAFRLPGSEERARMQFRSKLFGYLRYVVIQHDTAGLEQLLQDEEIRTSLLQSPERLWIVPTLMNGATLSMQSLLLPLIEDDEESWLLASLHPSLLHAAWLQREPEFTRDEIRQLRLTSFPLIDTRSESIPELIVQKWRDEARQHGSAELVTQLLASVEKLETWLSRNEHPERLRRYGEVLSAVAEGLSLPGETMERLEDFRARENAMSLDLIRQEEKEAVPDISVADESLMPVEAENLVRLTRETLRVMGAVFSLQTTFDARSRSTVLVRNIIFAGVSDDHTYDFSYNPQTAIFSHITRDGEETVFPLPGKEFGEWVRRS